MRKRQTDECGLGPALNVIGGKWKALILWEIDPLPRRFGELKRLVPGISEKMLIQQLREMEADGIVHREVYHEVPPKVVYSVTESGASLNKALIPLAEWGKEHATRTKSAGHHESTTSTAPRPRRQVSSIVGRTRRREARTTGLSGWRGRKRPSLERGLKG